MTAHNETSGAPAPAPALELRTSMDFAYGAPKTMAPGVVRIVANNPGPYTFKGTNSYLVGSTELAWIDPGPDDRAHLTAVLAAAAGRPIRQIVITHTHQDHVAGLPQAVAATGARTFGYGVAAGPTTASTAPAASSERMLAAFAPDVTLRDGDRCEGAGFALSAVYTPGHAPDHLCFALAIDGSPTGILFSGDHVMGWNTSVVAPPEGNMADYLASLETLIARTDDRVYLPGHGGRIENPVRMARAYLVHRIMREEAILRSIRDGARSINAVVAIVYKGLDPRLTRAAALSVEAHVVHLAGRGRVAFSGPPAASSDLAAV